MVAERITVQIESSVEAKRLWNALVVDGHNLLAKQVPEICSGVTFLQGDGGVGSIKQINFTTANMNSNYLMERVDEFDENNFIYSFSHVEGGDLVKKLVSAQFQLKFTSKAEGGCVVTHSCEYSMLPGVPQDQRQVEEMKAQSTALFKKMEAFLLSNPTLYCF